MPYLKNPSSRIYVSIDDHAPIVNGYVWTPNLIQFETHCGYTIIFTYIPCKVRIPPEL